MAPNNTLAYFLAGLVGTPGPGPMVPDGGTQTARYGRQGDLIVSELQGAEYEQTKRMNKFSLTLAATTTGIAAGNLSGAAAAASTQFALWNPSSSGKDLVLKKFFVGVISGTTPVPPIQHGIFNAAAVSIAPSGKIVGMYANLGGGPAARDVTSAGGTVITGGGAPFNLRAASLVISAGTYGQLGGLMAMEELKGDIIVPPGFGWVPLWASAGTTVLNAYSVTWDEVPV